MPFDRDKIARVSGFQSNCGLNCLVHSIVRHWDYVDGLHEQSGRVHPHPIDGDHGLLQHFRAYYGDSTLTKHDMISMLRRLSPYHREIVLSPVLRRMLPDVIQNQYPRDWAEMTDAANPRNTPENLAHRNRLGESGEYLSGDEVQYLAHHFGIKLGIYEGANNTELDAAELAGHRTIYGTHFNYLANAPLLKIWNSGSHWQYEENLSKQELQARNREYEKREALLLNDEQIRMKIRDTLANAPANKKAKINLARAISPRPLFPMLGDNDADWEDFFAKQTSFFAPLMGPMISMVRVFSKLMKSLMKEIKEEDTGRRFDSKELKEIPEAKPFSNFLKYVKDEQDVRELREKFRAENGSKECWDDLAEKFEIDENYSALDSVLRYKERKLLGEDRVGKSVFDDLGLAPDSLVERQYRTLLTTFNHPRDPNNADNHVTFSRASEEYQASCCGIRQKMIKALENAQLEAFQITNSAAVDPDGSRVLSADQRRALDDIADRLSQQLEAFSHNEEMNQAMDFELNNNNVQARLAEAAEHARQSQEQVRQSQQERDNLNARIAALQQQQQQQQQSNQQMQQMLQQMMPQYQQFQQQQQLQQQQQQLDQNDQPEAQPIPDL